MAANIHPIAFVIYGAGDSANAVCRLKDDRANITATEKFEGSGEPGGSCADDYGRLTFCHSAASM
jgi:hypothetical protein